MRRRTFIQHAVLSSACLLPACRGTAQGQVLRALVEQVVVPNTAAVAQTSRRLDGELARLAAEPTVSSLRSARDQWQRTLLSWKRADTFRDGPIMDATCLLRAMFWPVRPAAIDELLRGTQVIDDASIRGTGMDRRGLFALEYLLYSTGGSDEQIAGEFSGPAGERRARLARSLSNDISSCASETASALGNGKVYAGKFADGGQESIRRVAAQLVYTVEDLCAERLERISSLAKSERLVPSEIEGNRSRMSQQITLTYLQAAERLYLGVDRGLSELVKAQSSAADGALRSAFQQAIGAVSNLARPLEELAKQDLESLDRATSRIKNLERALKTELPSTLGLALTFSTVDGD